MHDEKIQQKLEISFGLVKNRNNDAKFEKENVTLS